MASEEPTNTSPDEAESGAPAPAGRPSLRDRFGKLLSLAKLSKRHKAAALAGLLMVVGILITIVGLMSGNDKPKPEEQLREALALLDESDSPDALGKAARIGAELDRMNYRNPEFPGAPEYIQGIVEFRVAETLDEADREPAYRRAERFLTNAGFRALDQDHRPEWSYALGKSLFYAGDLRGAEARLQEAVESFPSAFVEAVTLLQEVYLHHRTVESLNQALVLNSTVLNREGISRADLDRTFLRRAEILLTLGRTPEAEEVLGRISPEAAATRAAQVIRAEVDISAKRYHEARQILDPIVREPGLERVFSRQASYLLGLSYELEGDLDNASAAYGEASQRYPESSEGLAAALRRAEILTKDKRTEEALSFYKKALRQVRGEGFSNRWLTIGEFRQAILQAWQAWTDDRAYEAAIELSRFMTPLFSEVEARQQAASAYEQWAVQLEAELSKARYSIRQSRAKELQDRWRRSGKAYSDLADALITSPKYSDALWTSAEHYRKGHDSERALAQLTKFINTNATARLAMAYVRRGKVLMDLDRLDEALEQFEKVALDYPADIAAFDARYMIGCCHLERNEPELAEKTWREIITSRDLDPSANEWQLALFSLGRYLYQSAVMTEAKSHENAPPVDPQAPAPEATARWEEAIRRLDEFVSRYPQRPEVPEARCLLAKALQRMAEVPRIKLRKAETENARNELLTIMRGQLTQAHDHFAKLQEQLVEADKADMLDAMGQQILRDCYFERAHTLYALEEHEKAIAAYTSAANRYPEDPQSLLAYLQMANCYAQMGKDGDARGAAIQALLIHKNMPARAFQTGTSNISRDEWKNWLDWAREIHQTLPTDVQRISANPRGPS